MPVWVDTTDPAGEAGDGGAADREIRPGELEVIVVLLREGLGEADSPADAAAELGPGVRVELGDVASGSAVYVGEVAEDNQARGGRGIWVEGEDGVEAGAGQSAVAIEGDLCRAGRSARQTGSVKTPTEVTEGGVDGRRGRA